jgi:predicted MPP superfamily phosphohydrolase
MRRFRSVGGAVTAGATWFGLFVYAGRPLIDANPLIGWIAVLLAPAASIFPFFSRRRVGNWIGYTTLSLFAALLVVTIGSDLVRVARLHVSPLAVIGLAIVMMLVGLLQARRPRIVNIKVPIADLPQALDGYRIVQWSDVHIGPQIRRRFVESLVERTNALQPDAIAITGDLVDGLVSDLRDAAAPIGGLVAPDGVFYVTGNHEYYWRAGEWIAELRRLGLTFLQNEHRVVRDGLVIAGVTDPAGRNTHAPDFERALGAAPREATKILLAHRPQAAEGAAKYGVDLQLSGHTHGGQFFPFNLIIRWFQPIVSGLHRTATGLLYVSRGTGYWGPPSRLGVGGEITVLELHRSI